MNVELAMYKPQQTCIIKSLSLIALIITRSYDCEMHDTEKNTWKYLSLRLVSHMYIDLYTCKMSLNLDLLKTASLVMINVHHMYM